jgi:hypothetical protein
VLAAYTLPALAVAVVFGVLLESRVFTEAATSVWVSVVLTVQRRQWLPDHRSPA